MLNLFLAVIATQFTETKARETENMKQEAIAHDAIDIMEESTLTRRKMHRSFPCFVSIL